MQKFSLIHFISQQNKVTPKIAESIANSLLQPHAFSKKGAEKISLWYQQLSKEEKKYLYNIEKFKNALSQKPFLCAKTKISPLWLNEIFKETKYKIPPQFIQQIAEAFLFTTIKLPSNVEISVNAEIFFKTLVKGINNHPHLIDELKDFLKHAQLPLLIIPENGDLIKEKFLGLFLSQENALVFEGDLVHYATLDTLIHEIGHATDTLKFKDLYDTTSLYLYYDEIRQEAKSILIETTELDSKQGDLNPFEDLYFYIKQSLRKKYPLLNEEKIERATAFWFKNEIICAFSLSKNQLINLLNIWHRNKIRHTDKIYQNIEYLKKQYTQPCDTFYSFRSAQKDILCLFNKHIKKPFLFTQQMNQANNSFQFFSSDLLNELSNHSGFIEAEENLHPFMIKYCSFQIKNNTDITLSFNLQHLSSTGILKIQSFYAQKGIFLSLTDKILQTNHLESIERMARLIQHFFKKIQFKNEQEVYHFSHSALPKFQKNTIINFLTRHQIPYQVIEGDLFVQRKDLTNKNIIKYSKKAVLVPQEKTNNHHSNLFKIFDALQLKLRIYGQTEDQTNYLLFSQQEFFKFLKYEKLLDTALDIHQYYYENNVKATDIFVPNRLLSKKERLQQQKRKDSFQHQKD